MKVNNREEALQRYGKIEDLSWPNEAKWMTVCAIPTELGKNWINSATKKPTTKIYLNKDMEKPLLKALNNLNNLGLLSNLKTFDGCFSIRDVRGVPGSLSAHSYGLAIDINAKTNALGKTPTLSPDFVKCFTDEGFSWGGDFKRLDGMHFSYCWE